MTIIFLESPEPDTQGFWRKQNNTTRGSVNLREIGNLRGVSLSCGYVLCGSEFYMCIHSGYRNKSVTCHHPSPFSHSHFSHFDSHSHFSSLFLVLETQNLEPSRTKITTPIFLRNNPVCMVVDPYKARKRYTVTESLDIIVSVK